MRQVNILMQRLNEIEAAITAVENNITADNAVVFVKEVLNLLSGVGDGFVSRDYYDPDRYYSQIKGVKNIRIIDEDIYVKITAPSGYLLPEKITIRGIEYRVIPTRSTNFNNEVDY